LTPKITFANVTTKNNNAMKTKFKIGCVVLILFITVLIKMESTKKESNDVLLLNVEALAYGEDYHGDCFGYGSVECPFNGDRVYKVN